MESEKLFNNSDEEFIFEDKLFQVDFEKERLNNKDNKKQYQFIYEDFGRSGIPKKIIDSYIKQGYLSGCENSWKLFYPELTTNNKTEFYTLRIKNQKRDRVNALNPKVKPRGFLDHWHYQPIKFFQKKNI